MEKTLRILRIIKNVMALLAPALLFFGAIYYIVLSYTNSIKLPSLQVMTGFGAVVLAFMAVNLAYLICKIIYDHRVKAEFEQKNVCKSNFINKCYNFLRKYQSYIELALTVLSIIAAIMLLMLFDSRMIKYYWHVDYRISYVLWALWLYSLFTTLVSNDKKAFIMGCIFTVAQLGVLIFLYTSAYIMIFGAIGAYSGWLAYHILVMVYCLLSFMPYRLLAAHGKYEDILSTTSVGAGALNFLFGNVLYFATDITKKIFANSNTSIDASTAMPPLATAHAIVFIIFGISIALVIGNIALNLKRFIKTKDWLGLIDVALGIVGIVLCTVGIFTFTKFMLYFPTQYA